MTHQICTISCNLNNAPQLIYWGLHDDKFCPAEIYRVTSLTLVDLFSLSLHVCILSNFSLYR